MRKRTVRGWLDATGLKRVLDSLDIIELPGQVAEGPETELGTSGRQLVPGRKVFMLWHCRHRQKCPTSPARVVMSATGSALKWYEVLMSAVAMLHSISPVD